MSDKIKSEPKSSVDARFVRLPSIAERKLGRDYSAPIRLDPRILDQMQLTISQLGAKYAETLTAQITLLLPLIERTCAGIAEARAQLYSIIHDVRGLAGTFGHPIVGSFAKSLCGYMESHSNLDQTILRFHIEAMRDALEDHHPDAGLARETLRSLGLLIDATDAEKSRAERSTG